VHEYEFHILWLVFPNINVWNVVHNYHIVQSKKLYLSVLKWLLAPFGLEYLTLKLYSFAKHFCHVQATLFFLLFCGGYRCCKKISSPSFWFWHNTSWPRWVTQTKLWREIGWGQEQYRFVNKLLRCVYLVQDNLVRLENISLRHDFENKQEKVLLEASRHDLCICGMI
jgi:hypothetical protein